MEVNTRTSTRTRNPAPAAAPVRTITNVRASLEMLGSAAEDDAAATDCISARSCASLAAHLSHCIALKEEKRRDRPGETGNSRVGGNINIGGKEETEREKVRGGNSESTSERIPK